MSAIAIAVVVLVGVVRLTKSAHLPFTSFGDVAFVELGVLHALHGGVALGVYSRFGWHHPGPALFYALAPVYWLNGEHSRSLFLGAWIVNGASAVAAVLVVRARVGEIAARITASFVLVFFAAIGFRELIDPWNPKLVALPLLLLMVSTAGCLDGSRWLLVLVIAVGSYLVQADIGTAPIAVVLVGVALVAFVCVGWRSGTADQRTSSTTRWWSLPWAPATAAAGVGVVIWSGPIVEQLTSRDGNLSKIIRFALHPRGPAATPRTHSLHVAIAAVTDRATAVPLGNSMTLNGSHSRYALIVAFASLGLLVGWLLRRRSRFLATFALMTPMGLVIAVVATMRIAGPLMPYLLAWTQVLLLPVFVAGTWLVVDSVRTRLDATSRSGKRRGTQLLALTTATAVIVTALVAGRLALHRRLVSYGDSPDARAVAHRVEHLVGKSTPFVLRFVPPTGYAQALILQLEKDGARFHVDPPVALYRGNEGSVRDAPVFVVRPSVPPSTASGPGARRLFTVGHYDVWGAG